MSQLLPSQFLADKAANILAALCMRVSSSIERPLPVTQKESQEAPTWVLKANVTVFRHADRTPKVPLVPTINCSLTQLPSKNSNSTFLLENLGPNLL